MTESSGTEREVDAVAADEKPGRRPDILTLVAGLISLAAAAMVLSGWTPHLGWLELRWVLAVAAVGVGALLLVGSLRAPRDRR